jgi:hypothetical protein
LAGNELAVACTHWTKSSGCFSSCLLSHSNLSHSSSATAFISFIALLIYPTLYEPYRRTTPVTSINYASEYCELYDTNNMKIPSSDC